MCFIPNDTPHGHFGKDPPPDCFTIGCELPPNWQAVYTGMLTLRLINCDITKARHCSKDISFAYLNCSKEISFVVGAIRDSGCELEVLNEISDDIGFYAVYVGHFTYFFRIL